MPTVAIIGTNRGIGLALLREYAASGWTVHATVRDAGKAGVVGSVQGDVHVHPLELANDGEITALGTTLAGQPLDVLIHNAGVYGKRMSVKDVAAVNVHAPIKLVASLLACVAASDQRKIVIMTSQMGAREGRSGSLGVYGDSKAALNDAFRSKEPGWKAAGVTAIVMHPGWVRTDMGGEHASLSPRESALGIKGVVESLTPDQHGQFLTWDGHEHPW